MSLSDLPPRYARRDTAEARLIGRLQKLGSEFTFTELMAEIKAEGLKIGTIDRLLRRGQLKFLGKHRNDQRYTL